MLRKNHLLRWEAEPRIPIWIAALCRLEPFLCQPHPKKVLQKMNKEFSQEDEKEFQQIYQELVDKLNPANAEEEKFYAGIAAHLLLDRKSKLESSSARGRKTRKTPSALKHGAYAKTAVLGDEDPKEFKKLHRDLIDEFAPQGAFEDHIVADMARLMWRKENLATNRLATLRLQQIRSPGEVLGRPYNIAPREPGKPYFNPPSEANAEIVSAAEDANGTIANGIDRQFDEGPSCRRTIRRID